MVTYSDECTKTVSECEDYSMIYTLFSRKFRTNWVFVFTELKKSIPHPDDLPTLEMNEKSDTNTFAKSNVSFEQRFFHLKKTSIAAAFITIILQYCVV